MKNQKCGKCPADAVPGKTKCEGCLAAAAGYQRRFKAARIAAGLCPADGKPLVAGKTACEDCLRKQVARVMRNANRRRADVKCWGCGSPPVPRRKKCEKCLAYFAKRSRDRTRSVREKVISHYGGRCECCGVTDYEFLSLDHIHGGGRKHRRDNNLAGIKLYTWIVQNNYPAGEFRILCHNCNSGRHLNGGTCPHVGSIVNEFA